MKKIRSKNTDQGIITSNGIIIDGDIALSTSLELNKDLSVFLRALLAVIASVSTMQILGSFLNIESVSFLPTVLMCISITAVSAGNAPVKAAGFGYIVLQVIYSLISLSMIRDGFYLCLDKYLQRASISSADIQDIVRKIPKDTGSDAISRFMIFVGTIVALLVAISCIVRMDFAILFTSTFPFVEIGLYHGWEPPTLYIIALVLVWITVVSVALVNHSTNKAGMNNTFAVHRRKKAYFFTSKPLKNKFFTVYITSVAVICAIVFSAAILFSSLTGFVRPKAFTALRQNITEAINNFSFTSLQNLLADYDGGFDIFSIKTVGGTNGGRLGRRDGISFDGSTALNAKIKLKPSDTLYLRGYVAGKYEDNCWDPISVTPDAALKDAFGDIPLQNFNYQMIKRAGFDGYEVDNTISIAVVGASRRFAYAPYNTDYLSDTNEGNERVQPTEEGYVKLRARKYILDFEDLTQISNGSSDYDTLKNTLLTYSVSSNSLTLQNRLYYSFVRENYTEVNNSATLNGAMNEITKGMDSNSRFGITYAADCVEAIKNYFRGHNFYYNLTPGKTPDGEDFIDYFLQHPEKSGYCSYYASAGTMLMRMFGFPARYVEGYIVTPADFELNNNSEASSLEADITDRAAHAWCEIFVEGIGWLPVEFTPGYDNGSNPNQPSVPKKPENNTITSAATTTASAIATPSQTSKGQVTTSAASNSSSGTASLSTSVSSNKGGGGTGQNGGETSPEKEGLSVLAKVIIGDIIFVAAVIMFIILHRRYKLNNKYRKTHLKDRNEAVKYIYAYYLKYLSLLNISDKSNITDEKQALKLINSCHKLELGSIIPDLSVISDLAIEAEHSNNKISDKEYSEALSMLKKLSDNVVRPKLSGFGRFISKWLYGLY